MLIPNTLVLFTVLVAVVSWWKTRGDSLDTKDGYFLAGRSLTGPVIAGSLMLTNLSSEQLVGQAGQSYATNMGPMAWDGSTCLGLLILAFFFLPKYLKMGITTVPEFLEERYDVTVKRIVSFLFLLGYLLTSIVAAAFSTICGKQLSAVVCSFLLIGVPHFVRILGVVGANILDNCDMLTPQNAVGDLL